MPTKKNRATEIYEGVQAAMGGTPDSAYLALARVLIEGILKERVQLPEEPAGDPPPADD